MRIKSSITAPILVLVVYILTVCVGYVDFSALGYSENIYLSAIVVRLLVLALPGIFYIKLKGSGYTLKLGFAPIGPGKLAYTLFMLGVLVSGVLLLRVTVYGAGGTLPSVMPELQRAVADAGGGADVLYVLVSFVAVPAACEEFVFRSILLTEYSEYGCPVAVIASALLYALLGFSGGGFVIFFFAGLVYAVAFYTTRSYFAPLIIHAGFNIYSLWLDDRLTALLRQPTNSVFLIFFICVLFLLTLIFAFGSSESIYYIYGTSSLATPSYYDEKRKPFSSVMQVFFSPAMLVCVIFFFVVTLGGL